MRNRLVVALAALAAPVVAWGASAGPPVLDRGSPVWLWVGVAAGPDAARTEVWLLEPGATPTAPRFTVEHPAGQGPRGAWDDAAGTGWLVVEEGKPGVGARLVRFDRSGATTTVMRGLASLSRPTVVAGGVLVATGSIVDGDLALARVDGRGPREVFRARTPWLLPAGVDAQGDACAFLRDGDAARLACGPQSTTRWASSSPRVLHPSWGKEAAWALVENGGAWAVERSAPAASWPASDLSALVVDGTVAGWGLGGGRGLRVLDGDKPRDVAAVRGYASSPVWMGSGAVVVRLDSVDARGQLDGRMPTGFQVVDLRDGRAVRVRSGGSVIEVLGGGGAR